MTTVMGVVDKASGRLTRKEVTISPGEGIRADTTLEGGAEDPQRPCPVASPPATPASSATARSACVVMNAKLAEQRGHPAAGHLPSALPWPRAASPDEMGIGPVFAIPRLLQRNGLKVDDIGL